MNLKEKAVFFFTTFHSGSVNVILHVASLPLLYIGFIEHKILYVVLAFVIEECGHVYNYYFKIDSKLKQKYKDIIPFQLTIGTLLVVVLAKLVNWI